MKTKRTERKLAIVQPAVSARKALLKPLKYQSQSELKANARKLQQLGKANGPNDPSLT
jgi:hypothetical protein